jgi:biotin transport system substrate-specific component
MKTVWRGRVEGTALAAYSSPVDPKGAGMSNTLALSATRALLGPPRSDVRRLERDAVLVVGGCLLVAGAAQVSIHLPFTPVPVTGQTFAVLLVGASLGSARGLASLALYLAVGIAGLPFFAGGASGGHVLMGASGGYLVGFALAGAVTGFLAQRGWDRSFSSALGAMLTGNVLIYLIGVPWLAHSLGASPLDQNVLLAGLYPFIPGDMLKLYLASALLPTAWRLVGRRESDRIEEGGKGSG